MMVCPSREEWLKVRTSYIGGSDAACIVGANPWKSNIQLWEEKTGRRSAEDISGKPAVQYGIQAEPLLRELFRLDYPQLRVDYLENNIWTNEAVPFAHASLDGWLTDPNGRRGILEIKTTTIQNSTQKSHWQNQIPQNYYIQVLHYLMVTGWDFAILKAKIKWELPDTEPFAQIKHFRIERSEVEADLEFLENSEREFYKNIKTNTPPPLILPEI